MSKEQNFDNDQRHSQNKKPNDFPSCQAGEIVAEKKECETNRRNDSRQTCSGNFEFEISADDASQQKQGRQRRDPKGKLFEAGGIE